MEIEIQLTSAPIPDHVPAPGGDGTGAWVEFRGLVRGQENGSLIQALDYEAYPGMAEREIRRILEELDGLKKCAVAKVIHRTGLVPVGEAAIYVGIGAKHRAEAFAMLTGFMDRLKQDVPIWKARALEKPSDRVSVLDALPAQTARPAACSAAEVMSLLKALCQPLPAKRVSLREAPGRVMRESFCAAEDQPAFDRSSVDGYAVRQDDPATEFRILDEIRAGEWKPRQLQLGEAVRIATGGALPCEGLQVIMKEEVRVAADRLAVLNRDAERNIRFRGEDARAGQELVSSGTVLQPGTLGLLASAGCACPLVTRLPRAAHLATGSELVGPEEKPGSGQIRDSNSTLVRAFLGQWGIVPDQQRVGEDEDAIREALAELGEHADLLLISGGASVGEHDFTLRLLEHAGFNIHVSKTNARPGKPLIVGQRGQTLAFGLPGNPLAHFVCLNLYVRTALNAWAGVAAPAGFSEGFLAAELDGGGNTRETFWPARWTLAAGQAMVQPLRWSSSGDLTALATANALIRVHGGMGKISAGSKVEFLNTTGNA